jgi:PIN domain nuclease of toxin-antitoxin system
VALVLDASALLAALLNEPGAERVDAVIDGALISTVNLAEVVGHLAKAGAERDRVAQILATLPIVHQVPDEVLAIEVGLMRSVTDRLGLSLGDRFCLALAKRLDAVALTADRAWANVAASLGVEIELIR